MYTVPLNYTQLLFGSADAGRYAKQGYSMKFEDSINNKLDEVWSSEFTVNNEEVLLPLYYPELKRNCPLFIGMNPSFSSKGFKQILKEAKYEDLNVEEYFKWNNRNDRHIAIELSEIAKNRIPFFTRFKNIAEDLGDEKNWEHIDLFHYRHTNQNEFKKKIFQNESTQELNSFGLKQIEIFKEMFSYINPIVVIVANAQASNIFEKTYPLKFSNDRGHHIIEMNGKHIPVFLCSMLSGQRALDNYSYQRLKWHIKFSLESIK